MCETQGLGGQGGCNGKGCGQESSRQKQLQRCYVSPRELLICKYAKHGTYSITFWEVRKRQVNLASIGEESSGEYNAESRPASNRKMQVMYTHSLALHWSLLCRLKDWCSPKTEAKKVQQFMGKSIHCRFSRLQEAGLRLIKHILIFAISSTYFRS